MFCTDARYLLRNTKSGLCLQSWIFWEDYLQRLSFDDQPKHNLRRFAIGGIRRADRDTQRSLKLSPIHLRDTPDAYFYVSHGLLLPCLRLPSCIIYKQPEACQNATMSPMNLWTVL